MDLHSARWRKSSRSSGGGNGDCVEVADFGEAVAVRDSKHPEGTALIFTSAEWMAFLAGVKGGEFDPGS